MMILFPKKDGVKIATTIIWEEILAGASFKYLMGMLDFALRFKAITEKERDIMIEYMIERGN